MITPSLILVAGKPIMNGWGTDLVRKTGNVAKSTGSVIVQKAKSAGSTIKDLGQAGGDLATGDWEGAKKNLNETGRNFYRSTLIYDAEKGFDAYIRSEVRKKTREAMQPGNENRIAFDNMANALSRGVEGAVDHVVDQVIDMLKDQLQIIWLWVSDPLYATIGNIPLVSPTISYVGRPIFEYVVNESLNGLKDYIRRIVVRNIPKQNNTTQSTGKNMSPNELPVDEEKKRLAQQLLYALRKLRVSEYVGLAGGNTSIQAKQDCLKFLEIGLGFPLMPYQNGFTYADGPYDLDTSAAASQYRQALATARANGYSFWLDSYGQARSMNRQVTTTTTSPTGRAPILTRAQTTPAKSSFAIPAGIAALLAFKFLG